MVVKPPPCDTWYIVFESSVNLYGSKTSGLMQQFGMKFESSVNLYGSKTTIICQHICTAFESSVNLYGSKTYY